MTSIVKIDGEHLVHALPNLSIQDQELLPRIAAKFTVDYLDSFRKLHSLKRDVHPTMGNIQSDAYMPSYRMEDREEMYDNLEVYYDYYPYEDEDDEEDEVYYTYSPSLCIGNRRWGDSGYVRSGRQEARPVQRSNFQDTGAGSSREPKKKEAVKSTMGRRAKRKLKREAANKAAAEKHQEHLMSRTPK
ncbi:hypothetical protein F3Y22_tig00110299pilonHSYRG00344 [Hibiscus syriacus]|uniref:Uncharacterized protein n=1 Tax=Hibiscus syriacus TaxID=106335 RepID=A0A6A3B455_HIBSY|nr:hypothetical protein F3Y22_tig00110299pilonHSYRG00344 [Hibiscus syriacus]